VKRFATASSIVIFLLPIVVEGQEAPSSQADRPLTAIRGEMLSEYRFTPPGTKPSALPTSLQSDSPPLPVSPAGSGDVVKMAPFEVRESALSVAALQSIEQPSPEKPPATVASKLGIGERDFMVGNVHAFVISIFYVPFIAGFSW
jgi:hypothetical protein